ncbi:hypothetical protein KP509_1Z061200 [Ceratopteris richardii]|nr:hypothetical protein KP509_1Z061200 [Ceratopteris richardii]
MHSFKSSGGSSSRASGTANALLPDDSSGCSLSVGQLQFASYSQERSSLFVKILANLHCFNPEICPANEKDRFLNMFVGCLMAGPFTPGNSAFFLSKVQTAVRVCENLFWLLDYVSSLSSDIVSDEDLQLVSTFYCALHDSICPSAVFEDPCEEDPVVAYVRDGHERKRKDFLNRWQQSERWKRIHSFEPSDDKEHSNAGSSVHKSMSNTSSPQAIEEQDTNELVKNCYEVPMTKRARDLSDREEGMGRTQKRQQTYQQSFIESTLMDWTAQQAELYGKKKSLHSEVEKHYGEIGLMNVDERMDLGNSGSSTLKPKVEYLDSDIRNSSTDFSHEEVQESAETCSTYNEAHLSSEREIHRSGMQNMENVGRDPCRDISACKEIKPPDKDGTPLDADGSVNMDSVTEVDGKALGLNDENLQNELSSSQIKGNAYRTLEINIESEKYTNFHIDKAVSNNESSIMHMEASLLKKKSEHLMTPNNDLQEFLEGAGVESTAETDSSGIEASNPVHNQTADSEIEKSNTVFKIKLEAIDVTGEIATDAHSKFRETREIGDTQLSTEAQCEHHDTSGNNGSKPKLCVQHGIDLKFELKVEDLEVFVNAVRHQAQRSDPFGSEENRLQISNGFSHDKLINALQIDVMQLQNKDGKQSRDTLNEESSKASFCEVPQLFVGSKASQPSIMEPPLSLPRPLHMDAVGMFCISGPGTTQMSSPPSSQLPIHKDSLMHASNASRNTALDASCFPEIKTCGIGLGHSMPRPLQRVPSSIIEPKKRKRNIMNDEQMAMIENALLSEPYLRRHPDLIMQWTNKLNEIVRQLVKFTILPSLFQYFCTKMSVVNDTGSRDILSTAEKLAKQ